ncbi:MAG TPA: DUF4192 domain-containing protein [Pseudonocardiaceae bacterium]|nr:DUF4192 domain-containing protein [Pseudonocardiaceae bacterium]
MTTTPPQPPPTETNIRITESADLLAAVPHLLGFHPVDSLVVIGMHGREPMSIGLTLRVDLPPPQHYDLLAGQLAMPLAERKTDGVILVIIGGGRDEPTTDPPGRPLMAYLEAAFADAGIAVVHRLWTPRIAEGAHWRCYDDIDCGGVLPDPTATPLAAAAVVAGAVTMPNREAVVATLAPEDRNTLARRAKQLDARSRGSEPGDDSVERGIERLTMIRAAIDSAIEAPPILGDEDVLDLMDALADHRVRDACLIQEDEEHRLGAERLWTALVRATPSPERAEPASLLAFYTYLRGDGVLTGIALEQAEKADPGHRLTVLLRESLQSGLPPRHLLKACTRAADRATHQLTQERPK